MKYLLTLALFSTSLFANESSYKLVEDHDDYLIYSDVYDEKYAYIKGLEEDLFQKFTLKNSRGPGWKKYAEDFLDSENDFHEWASYFGERVEDSCDEFFSNREDIYEAENDWELRWIAVKPIRGSQKTAMYVVEFVTLVFGDRGTCELVDGEFVFQNKKVPNKNEAEKIYLGRQSFGIPRELR